MLLGWAKDREGRRVSVATLDAARRRARAPFACIGCGEPLIARLGSIRARHFAHRPGSRCPLTRPESALHLNAKERLGITSMVISHDIASAFKVADRLAVLYDGHLAAEGTPDEVRRSKDPYVQHFLSLWFEKQ